ncbi:MAG: gliding motility-associated C-terminal domain-containing protein [Bacteroidales bacterium]|nr:gliding motility-associated C-terminal domain-containing protein [Bacteroidales bacterium]
MSFFTQKAFWAFCILLIVSTNAWGNLIVTHPQSQVVCKSDLSATFEVVVTTGIQVNYQWYKNGSAIPGARYDRYTATTEGMYHCVVTKRDGSETETSSIAVLTFIDVPSIADISLPVICNKSPLQAEGLGIQSNGSNITGYTWKIIDTGTGTETIVGGNSPILNLSLVDSTYNNKTLQLTITNGCPGQTSMSKQIEVRKTPDPPTVIATNYCYGVDAVPLSIVESNKANWYTTGGTLLPGPPTPNTAVLGTQSWKVSQTIEAGGLACEGYKTTVDVEVLPVSALPVTTPNIDLCHNDPVITLSATGDNIQWYDSKMAVLSRAPQIRTSDPGIQEYYVTQTEAGKCESQKQKVVVNVKASAAQSLIIKPDIPVLCPNQKMNISLSVPGDVTNPIYRWYDNSTKSGPPIHTGSSYETPLLTTSVAYYVTLEYDGHCESNYPETVIVYVRDNDRPNITAPPNIVVSTNDGVCYATNVTTGLPDVGDNCTSLGDLRVYNDPPAPSQYELGSTSIVWWVEDESSNKEKAQQTITVVDREYPKGTCPDDIDITINPEVTSAVVDYDIYNYTDNCSGLKITLIDGLPSGSVFPLGETIVRHEIVDTAMNTVICEFKVNVHHPYRELEVALRVSAYEICSGQSVTITPVVSGGTGKYTYSWKPRVWTSSVMLDFPLTTTQYEVEVSDGVVSKSKSVDISVLETPGVSLTFDKKMDEILEGDEVTVKATSGFASYQFLLNNKVMQEVGMNDQIAFQAELGTYIVRVFATDENYCVAQDQIEIAVESRKLPNVFTPNRDGKNELFLEGYDLTVFSRSGEQIYKGTSGWDGTYRGKLLPQGTFLYVVRRTMNNGEFRIYKGTVTLKL